MVKCVFLGPLHPSFQAYVRFSQPLLKRSLSERRDLLRQHFHVVPGEFDYAKSSDSETTDEIQTFLEQSVKDGCEGLMIKMLESDESYYEPSRRSINWLKVKFNAELPPHSR
jgi:DNA ligase 1